MALIWWLASTALGIWLSSLYLALRRNIAAAKLTGIPYAIVPLWYRFLPWFLLQEDIIPLLRRLPQRLVEPWLSRVVLGRAWNYGYSTFEAMGSDSFLTVAPGGIAFWTCDPGVAGSIVTRHREFTKPVESLQILNVYGPTVTASEGDAARRYRKLATPSFNEATHQAVWKHAIQESGVVADFWLKERPKELATNVTRMALHIISAAGLGRHMDWESNSPEPGHSLSFTDAITRGLAAMPVIFTTPKWLLRSSPSQATRAAHQAYTEWIQYMEEMRDQKQEELRLKGPTSETLNLLGCVVQASDFEGRVAAKDDEDAISPEAVLGNIFILTFAGHDTSANTLTFALMVLTYFPRLQKRLQQELDDVFGHGRPDEWSLEHHLPKLTLLGAIFNETLRHYTVLPALPKSTGSAPRSLDIKGQTCRLPANIPVSISTSALHRHPQIWPRAAKPEPGEAAPYPLANFQPDIWLDDAFVKALPPTSFVPFSAGARACMGQRFAKIQFCAAVARLLRDCTLELAVDASAQHVPRRQQWHDTRKELARQLSEGVEVRLGIKPVQTIPISLVPRGQEKWSDCY